MPWNSEKPIWSPTVLCEPYFILQAFDFVIDVSYFAIIIIIIEHNEAEWLNEIKQGIGHLNQENLKINKEDITKQCKKIPNWKAAGLDGVQAYWIKKITSCHQRIAEQLDEILNYKAELPPMDDMRKDSVVLKRPIKRQCS